MRNSATGSGRGAAIALLIGGPVAVTFAQNDMTGNRIVRYKDVGGVVLTRVAAASGRGGF